MPKESDHFSIRDAIADIFRGYGAYVAPSITDPVYLRVILDDIKVAVGYWISSTPPGPNDIIRFLDNTDDTFYHHFAFLTNHEFSEDLVESARENDVVLLGRDDLETELGKTHLKLLERIHDSQVTSIDDVVDDHPLVRRLLADPDVDEAGSENTPQKESDLVRMLTFYRKKNTPAIEFGSDHERPPLPWGGEQNENQMIHESMDELIAEGTDSDEMAVPPADLGWMMRPEEDLVESKDPAMEELQDSSPSPTNEASEEPTSIGSEKGLIITPKLAVAQLPDLCAPIAPLTNAQMELVPYFVFAYTCTVVVKGGESSNQRQGVLAVNGVTLEAEEWELGFGTINELAMDYIRLSPRVDLSVARDLAFNGVVQIETKVLKLTVEEDGVEQNTTRKSFPDPSSIQLAPAGIYYFPHWHIRGEGGSMFIDAVNGDVISGQYQSSE